MAEPAVNRVALIGAGIYPREAYVPALHKIHATLVAIYSRSRKSASELLAEAKKFDGLCAENLGVYHDDSPDTGGLDQLLQRDDVTSVIVALPTTVQPAIVQKCLAAGKHVLMEKPIAKDVKEGVALIEEYESQFQPKKLILAVAEQFRFDRAHEKARQLVADGAIGKLVAAHARVWSNVVPGNKWYETEWRKVPDYQGGFLLDGGVHFVALLRYVSSDEIVETAAFTRQTHEYLPPLDTVHAALRFGSGALGTLSMSWASVKGEYSYNFIGTEGSLTITGAKGGTKLVVENAQGQVVSEEIIAGEGTAQEFLGFFAAIQRGEGDERASPRQALADVAVVESLCNGGGKVQV
ncbi:hypothetical protein VTN77DRAFT_1447 [Rasamsonia byssochlamydoides]|uniref:uncharacterized protein n=1 Tax=Rasamsonia byssochlamydoides TaxID=89139 RepID=UPI0037441C34